jgi:hypothetical protein
MDDSTIMTVGAVVGVALLFLGSRFRSKARAARSKRPPPPPPSA